jgi:hypothetical protein
MKPATRYAKSKDINIAFQVLGKGETDLVFVPGWVSNIDMMWLDPKLGTFLERLSNFQDLYFLIKGELDYRIK